jgi:hypothetical protein
MTRPGPDHFFSCPHCKETLKRSTVSSSNNFGATIWSDGYQDGPMIFRAVKATSCIYCGMPFFIEDAEDRGKYWTLEYLDEPIEQLPEGYEDAFCVFHAAPDALSELKCQTKDRGRLRYLCMQTWHIYNHAHRSPKVNGEVKSPAGFDSNLEQLIGLLDDDRGEDQLMKSEALRELGKHAECLAALENIDGEFSWATDQIRAMAQAGITVVSALLLPGEERQDS